jgi:hypothetical protein
MIMRKERLKKENEVFAESLINDFIKRIEDFNSDELALLCATYNQIKKYTEDIQNGYEKMFINFLPPQKTPRSIELLPAYKIFLEWIEKRKIDYEMKIKTTKKTKPDEPVQIKQLHENEKHRF